MILLDTHVWIWLNGASKLIPSGLLAKVAQQPKAISTISIWEAMILIEKGRVASLQSPQDTVKTFLLGNKVHVLDLTAEIAMLSRTLAFNHEDPADRFIAATAFAGNMPLATQDANLLKLPWLKHV